MNPYKILNSRKPLFISFEGCEGCGKSTQSKLLYNYLKSNGIDAILTREVGGTKAAEEIREILINHELANPAQLLLIMAARFEHIEKVINPALRNHKWVICDRFIDSSAAYQSNAESLPMDFIYKLHHQFMHNAANPHYGKMAQALMPDITFFMNISPDISLSRARKRTDGEVNKFDLKADSYHHQVYENFINISNKYQNRIKNIQINETDDADIIHNKILKNIF